jgi:hypothetical protein
MNAAIKAIQEKTASAEMSLQRYEIERNAHLAHAANLEPTIEKYRLQLAELGTALALLSPPQIDGPHHRPHIEEIRE